MSNSATWFNFVESVDYEFKIAYNQRIIGEFLNGLFETWAEGKTVNEIVTTLREAKIPCAACKKLEELADDPQLHARGMIREIPTKKGGTVKIAGIPVKLSESPGDIVTPAPSLGEHNEEIYGGLLGFDEKERRRLKRKRII